MSAQSKPTVLDAIERMLRDRVGKYRRKETEALPRGGLHRIQQCVSDRAVHLIEHFEQHRRDLALAVDFIHEAECNCQTDYTCRRCDLIERLGGDA